MPRLLTSQPSLSLSLFLAHTHTHITHAPINKLYYSLALLIFMQFSLSSFTLSLFPNSLSLSLSLSPSRSCILSIADTSCHFSVSAYETFPPCWPFNISKLFYPSFADKSKLHLSSNFLFTFCHISVFSVFLLITIFPPDKKTDLNN